MFHSARIKLTAWYVLIVMTISILFSVAIYNLVEFELVRDFHHVQERYNSLELPQPSQPLLEQGYLDIVEHRVFLNLLYLNLIILVLSAASGYFLAGRTLLPIKKMVNLQNQFISDASHELRTPITAAKTSIEVGLRDNKLTLSQAKELLVGTLEDINKMQKLTDNLLSLAQFENGQTHQTFAKVNLHEVLLKASEKIKPLAKKKNISIHIPKSDFLVIGNFDSLSEVFVILLDNAIKYSNKNSKVNILSKKTAGLVTISVTDKGSGISQADLPKIFDRFYRSETSRTKENVSGYGLGLSIAKKIITEHNGTIVVKSMKGKGSTFTINLPVFTS